MKIKCSSYSRDKIDFLSVCVHVCPEQNKRRNKDSEFSNSSNYIPYK